MKKFIHLSKLANSAKAILLMLFVFLSFNATVNAQCALVAEDALNIFVDENCEADIYWNQVLKSNTCSNNGSDFVVFLYDLNNNLIDQGTSFATIPSGNVGKTLKARVEYNVTGNQSPFTILNVFDKLNPTIGCYDKTTTYSGALAATDPTYVRTSSAGPSIAPNCIPGGTTVYYDVQEIVVSAAGSYTFALNGAAAPATQFFVAMYKDEFNPASVCTNFMYDNFAAAAGGNLTFTLSLPEAYTKYYLVTTSVANGQTGAYSWTITKPANSNVFLKKADCTYNLACYDNLADKVSILGLDNCNVPANVVVTNEVITENTCTGILNDTIFRKIVRTYQATDPSGNTSSPITATIYVSRLSNAQYLTGFAAPANKLVETNSSISCSAVYPKDLTYPTHPSPDYSGWPTLTINGVQKTLGPTCDGACNLTVTYLDLEVPEHCSVCKTRIARTWFINETSCAQRPPRIFVQLIEIADLTPPVVTCPPSVTVNTNQFNCFDSYKFPAPAITDNCQNSFEWDILIENNTNTPQTFVDNANLNNTPTKELPLGLNKITYTASDKCGNTSTCTFDVTVADQVQPVAVCQQFTVVALTYDGEAQLPAYAVNSGSYDNCSNVSFLIKKMGSNAPFSEYVTYNCTDLGSPKVVILQVKDAANNTGECMVNVEVQDKIGPTIQCPQNMEVECEYNYDPTKLRTYFGWPTAHDNCSFTIATDSTTITNPCYENPVKVITRNFTVTDNGGRTATCTQKVNFIRRNYFGYVNGMTTENGNGQITWPVNKSFTTCMNPSDRTNPTSPLHPNQSGFPTLNEYPCDQVGYTWSDFVLIDNDNDFDNNQACFKIIRTWTVLDDCHKINGTFVKWTYDQVLTITNNVPPTIVPTPNRLVCTYDSTCTSGAIELKYTCSDLCTQNEDLRWRYRLDYGNNNPLNQWEFTSPIHNGNNLDASGTYPIGTHKILWEVWDQCGNKTIREQLFTIQNCKKPTPICIDGLTVDLTQMTQGPTAVMKAWMFNKNSYHVCGYEVDFSFSQNVNDTVKVYGCNEQGLHPINMWVTAKLPDGSFVQDYCATTVEVQDNFNLCGNPLPKVVVSGGIRTEDNRKLEDINISMVGSEMNSQKTDANGEYKFPPISQGSSYSIVPESNDDYMNGLSTIDLVIIQKHILGLKNLKTPYSYVASDINNDRKITASDVLQLRKMILGVNEKFESNKSWRFIPKDFTFENLLNPIDGTIKESITFTNIENDLTADFIAVKIGDVSGDVYVNKLDHLNKRNAENIDLIIDNKSFNSGESIEIPVYSSDFNDVLGLQGTFKFDSEKLEFAGIESSGINIAETNISTLKANIGLIPMSWSSVNTIAIEENSPLFILKFNTLKSGNIQNTISMTSSITKAEAYNTDYEVMNINMNFRNENSGFELLQNNPNPFSYDTEIDFNTDKADNFTMNIYDVNGKLVVTKTGIAEKGFNRITINKSELKASGIMYYTLSTSDYYATRKMVVLK